MRKIQYILSGLMELVREHKLWFLAPFLFLLAFLTILVSYVGPTVVITFIYAGI